MLLSDIFVSISSNVDILTSLYTYGVLISRKAVNSKYIVIIGIDSHTQLGSYTIGYDLFLVTKLSESTIIQLAGNLISDDIVWQKISKDNYNLGSLLFRIFKYSNMDRVEIAHKYLGIKTIQDYKTKLKPIDQIIEIFNSKT